MLKWYDRMKVSGVSPNQVVFNHMVSALASQRDKTQLNEIIMDMKQYGFTPDTKIVQNLRDGGETPEFAERK
jgi:pentatricopeptide repeat protein